jgi:hypothetical protein
MTASERAEVLIGLCAIAALPMFVALARRNWNTLVPSFFMGAGAVFLVVLVPLGGFLFAIPFWLFALVYAFKGKRWTHNYGESSPGPPG